MKKYISVAIVLLFSFLNVGTIYAAADTWTQMTDFGGLVGTARVDAVGFSISSKGYIGTGFDGSANTKDFWEYDPIGDTWTQKADFGGTTRQAAVGFSIGSKGYIGTGYDGIADTNDFWEYDPALNNWTQKANFGGTVRRNAVGFSIGSKGYIGTGLDGSTYYKDFWEYNPVSDTWTQKANIESVFGGRRNAAIGFSIGSKGYIGLGVRVDLLWGIIPVTTTLQDFYEFDPIANTWTMKASFNGGARYDAIGFSIGDKGYVGMGFFETSSAVFYKDFWQYDPLGDTWTQKADFGDTVDPAETGRRAGVGFSIGNKGYIGLGYDGTYFYKDFWEYDSGQELLYGSFTGTGIWKWDGSSWNQVTSNNPEAMVVSGTTLYGDFGTGGIWKWDGANWTQTTPNNPDLMAATSTVLYGTFTGGGIWKWDGANWSQTTPNNPDLMAATSTALYGSFAGGGIWKWDGANWTQATPNNPDLLVASGESLYCSFAGGGIWKLEGTAWSQTTPNNPQQMVASEVNLYGSFAGGGIWKWDGLTWTQLTPNEPVSMVTGN